MSPVSAFSSGKQALRRGAAAIVAAGVLFGANAAQAGSFTELECKTVSGVAREVVKAVGKDTLSMDFRRSLLSFIAPDGKQSTCTGPLKIATPTGADIDAFNTIRGLLLAGPKPISLQERGLQSVASLPSNAL